MNNIFVLGSINMDLVFSVERIPDVGETMKGNHFFLSPGGKGANQAVACAKQNAPTKMIGSIGTDALSLECESSLITYHVDCEHVVKLENQTCGVAGIILEKGDNRIIINAGANEIHNLESILNILKNNAKPNDILISQLEIPVDIVKRTFEEAKKIGLKIILNASPAMSLPDRLFPCVDTLIVNENEIEKLTGITPNSKSKISESCVNLLDKGTKAVLLTLGEKGSVYVDSMSYIEQQAFPVEVVDTTAAGDTYIGVFVTQLLKKQPIEAAMKYASAGASLAIQKYGAQVSIPTNDMIEKFLKGKEGELHE